MCALRSAPRAHRLAFALAVAGSTLSAIAQTSTVVVTATRFAEPADTLPFGATVITAEDLQRSGAATVNEALMRLAGVPGRLDLSGGAEYALDLRGFGSSADANQVIVVDGQRLTEADLGGTRLSGIPVGSIERIEVLRGSGAVLYGEGASAGVIVITTRAGATRSGGSVALTGGSERRRGAQANAAWVAGDFALDATADRRLADGHRQNFASATGAASVGARWRHDGLSLTVRHADDRLDSGLPGSLTADQFAADPTQAGTPADHTALHASRGTAQLEWALPGGWTLAADGGLRRKASRSTFVSFGGAYDYDTDAGQWSLRARHVGRVGGGINTLAFGVDDNRWRRDVLGAFGSLGRQHNRGVFARDEFVLAGGTRLVAGLRREAVRKTVTTAFSDDTLADNLGAWELAALQPLSPRWQGFARVGRSFRLANVDEFSLTAPGAVLRPQRSRDAELGLRFRAGAESAEFRAYRSALTDEIGYDPAAGAFGANVNFDRTRRQGVEAEGRHTLGAAWAVRATLAWQQSRFVAGSNAGRDVALAVPRHASFGVNWQANAEQAVDAWLRAYAAQPVDFGNRCRLPGMATLDLRHVWRLQPVELALQAANLLDRRYATQAFGCTADGRATSIYPEPGRQFNASARWTF